MIPKIIHQIWIGDKPIPEKCKIFAQRVKQLHPDWDYKLWGNKEIFDQLYKEDKFIQNYKKDINTVFKAAHIADRARLLLLRDFGGVYVDVDANPVKSFNHILNQLHDKTTFFGGVRYEGQDNNKGALIDCTVMGSTPNSRMINECLGIYKNIDWAWGGKALSSQMWKSMGPDVCLFNYEPFYDTKIGPDTVIIHDHPNNRLWSWK